MFSFYDIKTGALKESHFPGYYFKSRLFVDTADNTLHTILQTKGANYFHYKLNYENNFDNIESENNFIIKHPQFDLLKDSTIIINDLKFYSINHISTNEKDSISLNKLNDGYELYISKSIMKELRITPLEQNQYPACYNKILNAIFIKTGIKLLSKDIKKIYDFFNMREYYLAKNSVQNISDIKIFQGAFIKGKIDANNDGNKDILIRIRSERYLNNYLICYDEVNKNIIWQREIAGKIKLEIRDIDNDNKDEIIIGTYSPCFQPELDYFDKYKKTGLPFYSYFRIFRHDGKDKIINEKPVYHKMTEKIGFNDSRFLYLKDQNKILIGFETQTDYSTKNLLLFDIKENRFDTLETQYNNLKQFFLEDQFIKIVNYTESSTELIVLNTENYEIIDRRIINKDRYIFVKESQVKLFGKYHYIQSNPFIIYNKNFTPVLQKDYRISPYFVIDRNNLFILKAHYDQNNHYTETSHQLKLNRTYTFKKTGLVVLAIELFLLLLYLFIKKSIVLPLNSVSKNYLVLYTIFGKLYLWKPLGSFVKVYKLPQKSFYR